MSTDKTTNGSAPNAESAKSDPENGPHKHQTPTPLGNREQLKTKATVFLGGLAPRVGRIHLEKLLQKFGTIERLDIKTASTSKYCFCQFQLEEEALKAINNLDGKVLLNRRLTARTANERVQSSREPTASFVKDKDATRSASDLQLRQQILERRIRQVKKKIEESKST
jgi:RNA recognition motif-containing protein